ncbi:MAG: indole-3-glycerol phosphate synthase TrpC [bacterium]|nr:indole-3-glycerol phosphate synthase TrpC [bacterium]
MDILQRIAKDKRLEIEQLKQARPIDSLTPPISQSIPFKEAIGRPNKVNIIAEIKKGSPSKGVFAEDFDPAEIARKYAEGGAAALSVLTESKYFFGDYSYIETAKSVAGLPVLCKDFVVDEYQLHHAVHIGADAVLLIVALHTREQLGRRLCLAKQLGLDALVEIHNESELDIALTAEAEIIGVNNRDLTTFEVSLETAIGLADSIPKGIVRVAESGIFDETDIQKLQEVDYNCFLIGEALMRADDPAGALRRLQQQ